MRTPLALLSLIVLVLPLHAADPAARTLASFGAAGDGKTDDCAAIKKALTEANGAVVDGQGKTYAIKGSLEVTGVPVDFRNATILQSIEPMDMSKYLPSVKGKGEIKVKPPASFIKMADGLPLLDAMGIGSYDEDPVLQGEDLERVSAYTGIRSLFLGGTKEKAVPVRLEKIKVIRGNHADAGSRNGAAGILIENATPLDMTDVEVTGDGKGRGIGVTNCSKVNLVRLNIHDIRWAPYVGDLNLPLSSVRNTFGWNNFPIYEYRSSLKKFVRVRIQEQLSGLFIISCDDVLLKDSRVAHLETLIEGRPYAIQADGMTINRVKNLHIMNCDVSFVWEGIDYTGAAGQDFLYENVKTEDCFSFGLKYAHPKQNGKVKDCVVLRSGNAGFEIEPGVENVEFINCKSLETGSTGFWGSPDGFRVAGGGKPGEAIPNRLSFINCAAINKAFPGAMEYGFLCAPAAGTPERKNTLKNCVAEGAKIKGIFGFAAQQ